MGAATGAPGAQQEKTGDGRGAGGQGPGPGAHSSLSSPTPVSWERAPKSTAGGSPPRRAAPLPQRPVLRALSCPVLPWVPLLPIRPSPRSLCSTSSFPAGCSPPWLSPFLPRGATALSPFLSVPPLCPPESGLSPAPSSLPGRQDTPWALTGVQVLRGGTADQLWASGRPRAHPPAARPPLRECGRHGEQRERDPRPVGVLPGCVSCVGPNRGLWPRCPVSGRGRAQRLSREAPPSGLLPRAGQCRGEDWRTSHRPKPRVCAFLPSI